IDLPPSTLCSHIMDLTLSSTAFSSYPSHEIWGMNSLTAKNILSFTKLMFYDSDSIQADCEAPSPEEIKRCLRMIRYSKSEATISELETLVQSARTWQLFEFLIRREQVIPHLIQLLRSHTTINLILAYRYGLMCIQLLVCVMAAGVTDEYDKRDDVYEAIRIESDGETRIWSRVADYASLVMCGAVMSGSDHQDAQRLVKQRFAGCYWGTKYVIFPKLGGLFKEDALWMLDELWEGRKDFLWVCNSFVRGSPGWSVLFTAFYHNIMEAGRPITLLQKLRGLLLRYSIFVPYPEFDHICKMIGEIEDNNSITYFMDNHPSVDEQEANLMVDMFQRIFESSRYSYGRSTPLVIRYPFGLVYHSALAIIPDRAPPLLALVIECSWEGPQDPCSILKFKERISDSFEYAQTIIVWMSTALMVGALQRQSKKVAIAVWTKLRDINILELIGRLCSITVISTNGSADGLLLSQEKVDDFTRTTRHLMGKMLTGVINVHELGNISDIRHTWDKVWRYIDLQLSLHPPGPVQHRIRVCQSVWLDVGSTFNFEPQSIIQRHQCMNPRCPDPFPEEGARFACMRCCWVHYCSNTCQSIYGAMFLTSFNIGSQALGPEFCWRA
ncbi:unnamed protein product, partial [Rhizoctonia solani]